jgi:hypothetical protein
MRRRRGVLSSPATKQLDETTDFPSVSPDLVYCTYPEMVAAPQRSYYLPVIDGVCVFYAGRIQAADKFVVIHELMHSMMAQSYSACLQRYYSFDILSGLFSAISYGYKILVPSLILVGENGRLDHALSNSADELNQAIGGMQIVQEIVANAGYLDASGWNSEVRAAIDEEVAELGHAYLPLFDQFLTAYKRIGLYGALMIGSFVLNQPKLSEERAAALLKELIDVAGRFTETGPPPSMHIEVGREFRQRFAAYMDQHVSRFSRSCFGQCPLSERCLPAM